MSLLSTTNPPFLCSIDLEISGNSRSDASLTSFKSKNIKSVIWFHTTVLVVATLRWKLIGWDLILCGAFCWGPNVSSDGHELRVTGVCSCIWLIVAPIIYSRNRSTLWIPLVALCLSTCLEPAVSLSLFMNKWKLQKNMMTVVMFTLWSGLQQTSHHVFLLSRYCNWNLECGC